MATREFPAHRSTEEELAVLKYSNFSIVNDDIIFPERKLCVTDPMILAIDLLGDDRALVLHNIKSAIRVATSSGMHPEVQAKPPPLPEAREDVFFVPIFCELVARSE